MLGAKPLLFVVGLAISCSYIVQFATAHSTDPSEVNALRAIRLNLIDPFDKLNSWRSGDPCTSNWTGIICESTTNDTYLHVHELLLLNYNLSGTLAPKLGLLSHMKILDFMWNNISGTIPKEIGSIKSLKLLSIRNCSLRGAVPDLSAIPQLTYLDLSWNQLEGPIPSEKLSDNMTTIDLSNNNLNGSIPPNFSHRSKLQRLSLENNKLHSSVPTAIWQNTSSYRNKSLILDFQNNSLTELSDASSIPENVTVLLFHGKLD